LAVIVTGVAGFIGYHTATHFLDLGINVIGIDSISELVYPAGPKLRNIAELSKRDHFEFHKLDLSIENIDHLISRVDTIINLAGAPGQAISWLEFEKYQRSNILVVDKLLKLAKKYPNIYLLQISSSSVMGNTTGIQAGKPLSPYGVSKLAAEELIRAYQIEFGVKCGILRLFSVFGPGQRPDMAYSIFCNSIWEGKPISIHGDGSQSRSNTYISDVTRAIYLGATKKLANLEADVTSAESITLLEAIKIIADEIGKSPVLEFGERKPGDQFFSQGNPKTLRTLLNFETEIPIETGLRLQVKDFLKEALDK